MPVFFSGDGASVASPCRSPGTQHVFGIDPLRHARFSWRMDSPIPTLSPEVAPEGARPADLPHSVRVKARLSLALSAGDGATRITARREEGAYRFRMPKQATDRHARRALEALIVNVAGGLAGGDSVSVDVTASEGACFLGSSVTAERIYRAHRDETRIALTLAALDRATLVWLPQETILHEGAKLARPLAISCARDARVLFGDLLHLGRPASGEGFARGSLAESWRIRFADRLVLADETRLADEALAASARPGLLGEANSIATLVLLGKDAPERLEPIRVALARHPTIEAGATQRDGLVFARLMGKDGMALRRAYLVAVEAAAGADMPLPRLVASELET